MLEVKIVIISRSNGSSIVTFLSKLQQSIIRRLTYRKESCASQPCNRMQSYLPRLPSTTTCSELPESEYDLLIYTHKLNGAWLPLLPIFRWYHHSLASSKFTYVAIAYMNQRPIRLLPLNPRPIKEPRRDEVMNIQIVRMNDERNSHTNLRTTANKEKILEQTHDVHNLQNICSFSIMTDLWTVPDGSLLESKHPLMAILNYKTHVLSE